MANSGEKVIVIKDLKKSFGKNEVLKKINLEVYKGENVVTLGKSGTGKSVTLQCIVGLLQPDAGSVNVLGNEIEELNYDELQEVRKKIGFVFQQGALYDSMTVRQNLEFPLVRHFKLTQDEVNKKVEEVLKDVGLSDAIDKWPSELSGGMRKRVGVARTIILNPEIMLWDEPTTGLDPESTRDISHLIRQMQEKYKVSSIIVTHDMICAKIVADRISVLKDGEYIVSDTYENLQKSDDAFVKSFFMEVDENTEKNKEPENDTKKDIDKKKGNDAEPEKGDDKETEDIGKESGGQIVKDVKESQKMDDIKDDKEDKKDAEKDEKIETKEKSK